MENLIVIKLGGSSITKKAEGKFEMNETVLKSAAKQISQALKSDNSLKLILVCGVGPFGHTNVVKYDLNNGIKTSAQEKGVEVTIKDCNFVAESVMDALENEGLKTEHVPGYLVCKQDGRKVISFDAEPYTNAVEKGIIPVTTGIMVKDKSLKWSVMSGDAAIAQITMRLIPKKVVIGTDVDGIFTGDPKEDKKAKLIEEISNTNLESVLKKATNSKAVDVTGGMKGKLEKLAETLNGTECQIFNLFTDGNLKKALLGEKMTSTKLKIWIN